MGSRLQLCGRAAAFAALVAGATIATPSAAQDVVPSAAAKDTARNLMRMGDEKFEAKDFDGALKAYRGANDIMRVPTTGLAVGETLIELGRLVEAREAFVKIENFPKRAGEPAPFQEARGIARKHQLALKARIPTLTIKLRMKDDSPVPLGAELRVDKELIPPTAREFPFKLDPGNHSIMVGGVGVAPMEEVVILKERETQTLDLVLTPIKVRKSKKKPESAVFDAGGGDEDVEQPPDTGPEDEGGLSPLVFVGFGFAAAGAIAGGITGGLSLSKASEVHDACPVPEQCGADQQETFDSATTLAHVSTISFAVAGAGAVVGIIGLAISGSGGDSDADSALSLQPLVGPGSIGLHGRW
jgi:hypothetical protein